MQEWAQAIRRANSRGELNLLLQLALYLARRNKPPRPQPPLQPPQPVVPPRMPQTTDELVARLRQAVHDGDEEVIQAAIEKSEEIARRG
ncbi:MAG: hypothetical protein FJ009_10505 [Chloroflexi bacterium]|nr:hypothetical protein [Chloroflexota bacterium]